MKLTKRSSTVNTKDFLADSDSEGKKIAFIQFPIMCNVEALASKARLLVEEHENVLKNGCYPDYEAVRTHLSNLSELYYLALVIKNEADAVIETGDVIAQKVKMLGANNV